MRTSFRFLALLLIILLAAPAYARDWFVKAGSSGGDGSQAKPFSDPFEALDKCEAGDSIHITAGRYAGKLDVGTWTIPYDNISLIGGYSDDFSSRDPWTNHTMLFWDRNSKNSPTYERIISNAKNTTLDGLFIDESEQNEYDDTGRSPRSLDHADAAVRLSLPGTVKNCIFVNTGREALICSNNCDIENNLFLNTFVHAIQINGLPPQHEDAKKPAIVKNNTFAWSWDDRAPGTGHDEGDSIYMSGPANISNNIFAFNDNNAIYSTLATERSSITDNVFFMNLYSNFKLFVGGQDVTVDDKTSDLWDETGLKAASGNKTADPGLPLDKDWMEATTKRTASEPGKVNMDDWNKTRQALGLDLVGTGGKAASGIAPKYPVDKVIALMTPKNDVAAGARIQKLEVHFTGAVAAGPAKSYDKSDLASWADNPDTVNGKNLEMNVAIAGVTNIGGIPDQYKQDDHEGIKLYDATGDHFVTGFYKKGSSVNRFVTDNAANAYDGTGKPRTFFTVKGIAYTVNSYPKAGFFIESITPIEAVAAAVARPKGRDWFVKAGATGGDGSKEKPFRDPYQALEKVESGDTIHVTGGAYVGKLHAGHWTVDAPNIAMLGGYSSDFSTRDPWKNQTLLYTPEDFKGSRGGYTFQGDQDHSNFILDGFTFDKKANNKYKDTGDLMPEESDKTPHLWLSSPGCIIRNCTFMNGAEGAIRMSTGQTLENNLFLNHYKYVVTVEEGKAGALPVIVKNNTFAFAWEERFGSGHGITADLLILTVNVHAVVDNNIFEFADQHAVRIEADPKDIELTNNVFAHNLFAEVYQTKNEQFVDNKNFDQLAQLGWKKCEGNVLAVPGLPIDEKWFNVYLNRTAYVEGKVTMDDWNQLRDILGQPMIATGGKAAAGMAPSYDRTLVANFVPKNAKVTAGERPQTLEVKFEGVARKEESHDYTDVKWEDVQAADNWDKLDGKRISLTVVIERDDNQYKLDDIKQEQFAAWMVTGPQGSDAPGLPIRVYVPKGTKTERVFNNAKGYSSGAVEETHTLKGIARAGRQLVVESAAKAD